MFRKSFRLVPSAVFAFLCVSTAAYSQSDNAGSSASSGGNAKGALTSIPAVREEVPSAKIARMAAADSAWDAIPVATPEKYGKNKEGGRVQEYVYYEKYFREYFENGLRFWQAFPEDKRKYEWLRMASSSSYAPQYWENIEEGARLSAQESFYSTPVNTAALENWKENIEKCKESCLKEPSISKEVKNQLMIEAVYNVLYAAKNRSRIGTTEIWLAELERSFEKAVNFIGNDEGSSLVLVAVINEIISRGMSAGASLKELREFLYPYKDSNNKVVRSSAEQGLRLLNTDLADVPFFSDPVFGNHYQLDLKKLKGKIVLLDYWSIYCSGCLKGMSELKPIYEKYKDAGFEVISLNIDSRTLKGRADKLFKASAGNWMNIMIDGKDESEASPPGARWKKIRDLYGFRGVPQMLFFDREGKLAMINGPLRFEKDIEAIIKTWLKK